MQIPRGERGSTLLDAVVGTALMLVVFIGIVGAFRLSVIAVGNNKARAGAIALANERLEYIRSLSYDSLGTIGGIPAGPIAQTETIELNDVTYTRRTFISYEDDPADGLGASDTNHIPTDYKAVKASVSWESRAGTHTLTLVSRVSPPGIETNVPGGMFAFTVVNATLAPVSNAQIRIQNSNTNPVIDTIMYTDAGGTAHMLGVPPASGYRITVTKAGYSTARTYDADAQNPNPIPAHLGVALDQTTAATFAIDVLASKTIETYTPVTSGTTTEAFTDASGVASSTNVIIIDGAAQLVELDGAHPSHGTFLSTSVSTSTLAAWKTFSWNATEPTGTDITFRVYDGAGAALIPDAQLPGNSVGFTSSPVDLSGIATSTYSALVVSGELSTTNSAATPTLDSWSIGVETGPHPLPNIPFTLTGAKTIGTTAGGALIYKYDEMFSSGEAASVTLDALEWDVYTVAVPTTSGYDVASACAPQPEALAPDTEQTTRLFLAPHTANSLLVDVKNGAGMPIPNASVRLARDTYDTTTSSDVCGNAFFPGLAASGGSAYTLEVQAAGYQAFSSNEVDVSGTARISVILNN